jgi:hypothetical protein
MGIQYNGLAGLLWDTTCLAIQFTMGYNTLGHPVYYGKQLVWPAGLLWDTARPAIRFTIGIQPIWPPGLLWDTTHSAMSMLGGSGPSTSFSQPIRHGDPYCISQPVTDRMLAAAG